MKTKINAPYFYFLVEPNVIFVYKLESEHYLTLSELNQNGEWHTYELNSIEDFETFDHETHQPLVGRGYFINQKDRNEMLEIINQQIHRQKKLSYTEDKYDEVHIVPSDAGSGSLRVALEHPKKVIGFQGFFSIGPLSELESKQGQNYRQEWLFDHINLENDDDFSTRFANTIMEIQDIPEHRPIYLWTGDNVEEQTGIRFIFFLLKEKMNPIYLINVNEYTDASITFTNQLQPDRLRKIFDENKSGLSQVNRFQLEQDWKNLSETNSALRIWENGVIKEASEDYYDSLILDTLENVQKEEFVKVGTLLGEIIKQTREVNVFYLEYRIRQLVYNGVLGMRGVPKSMRHYRVKLGR